MTNGGLWKSTSLAALVASVGLIAGGVSAKAADLGGDCCADLEERVAELEATTVRKGNRKVSLTISGFVAHNVMFWDDGTQSDMYIGDGGNYGSRFRFVGTAKISPNVTAGFLYEFGISNNGIDAANQLNGGDDLGGGVALRDTTVWLRHSQLGMIKVGHGSTATDNLVLIDLSGCGGACTPDVAFYNGGMILRGAGGFASSTALTWASAIRGNAGFDTARKNHILYETPSLAGFTLQTAVAEDNYWDVALRYAGELGGFRIAGGIGYQRDSEFNAPNQLFAANGALCTTHCNTVSEEIKGALSVMHVATGLFATFSAGNREVSGGLPAPGAYVGPDVRYWHLTGGISNNFTGIGRTVLFGEYGEHKGGLAQSAFFASTTTHDSVSDSKVTVWGLGITQHVDAAAMELFIAYKNFSLDATGFNAANAHLNGGGAADFSMVLVGTRINF
ncbi:MAG TPA: porin [Hyphomicrobiaceae bacterium]|nr:porin [Hyphomicrobiaceae bacterium]